MSIPVLYTITFILFIMHELEEIIFFNQWFNKNDKHLKERYPRLGRKMIRRFKDLSTKGFALIAFEETIILSILLLYAFEKMHPQIGLAVILMLSIHWLLTIIQSVFIQRIIPGTYTSFAGTCFGICTFITFANEYSASDYLKWGLLLFIFAMINLWGMHLLVTYYRKSKIK